MPEPLTPIVFVSYARADTAFVHRVIQDLAARRIEAWVDTSRLEVGHKVSDIENAITQSTLVFAYLTESYLASRWCMKELKRALATPRVLTAPFVDSAETLERLSRKIRDEISFGVLNDGAGYDGTVSEIAHKAWTSLQVSEQLVTSSDHILASPAVFKTSGYSPPELMMRAKEELILAGSNLRNWLTDEKSRAQLLALVRDENVSVTLIMGTYEALAAISPEGATHLRDSVMEVKGMVDALDREQRGLMKVHFHVGVVTLSVVFVDPKSDDGILFFSPRWAIQYVPHDRFSCVIDKRVNSVDLFDAIYGGVTLMIQGDAKTLGEMLAER